MRLLVAIAIAFLAACGATTTDPGRLIIETSSGAHTFKIELADDEEERRIGLMYRETLAPDAGMLFDFKDEAPRSMWMKNTLISLDMAFIDGEGRIVSIESNTTPRSLSPVTSRAAARAVLEVAGGRLAEIGAAPGDFVRHPIFRADP